MSDERVFNNDKNIKVFALGVLGQASTQKICDWGDQETGYQQGLGTAEGQ